MSRGTSGPSGGAGRGPSGSAGRSPGSRSSSGSGGDGGSGNGCLDSLVKLLGCGVVLALSLTASQPHADASHIAWVESPHQTAHRPSP